MRKKVLYRIKKFIIIYYAIKLEQCVALARTERTQNEQGEERERVGEGERVVNGDISRMSKVNG